MHSQYMTDMVMELSRDYFVARPFLLRLITADEQVGTVSMFLRDCAACPTTAESCSGQC